MIDKELVKKVASIAKINLSEEEIIMFAHQFEDIIKWFNELEKVNTKYVRPSFHPLKTENVFREDKVGKCLSQKEALSNTENKEGGYFKGPRAV